MSLPSWIKLHRVLESSLRLQKLCMHYLFMGWRGLGLPNWYLNGILDAVAAHLGCLECCQADFHRFSLIFIDLHGFSSISWIPGSRGQTACGGLWRAVAACGGLWHGHPAPSNNWCSILAGQQASRLSASRPGCLEAWPSWLARLLETPGLEGYRDVGQEIG